MQKPALSLTSLLKFTRIKVSLAVTFVAFASSVAAAGGFSTTFIPGVIGIFILSCGASALNQVQEVRYDRLMERTSDRPLPQGLMTKKQGIIIAVIILLTGFLVLYLSGPLITLLLGVVTVVWYNFLYTYLKKKTAFAVVPGSLTGAIPILMGWTAAGGAISAYEPWLLAFFMFMWQIPHFWLLMLRYGSQYQLAGLPSLPDLFVPGQMKNIIFSWIFSASVSSMMLLATGIWHSFTIRIVILLMNIVLLIITVINLYVTKKDPRHLFIMINVFMMLVFLLLIADQMIRQ